MSNDYMLIYSDEWNTGIVRRLITNKLDASGRPSQDALGSEYAGEPVGQWYRSTVSGLICVKFTDMNNPGEKESLDFWVNDYALLMRNKIKMELEMIRLDIKYPDYDPINYRPTKRAKHTKPKKKRLTLDPDTGKFITEEI